MANPFAEIPVENRMSIRLRNVNSDNERAPKLRGWIAVQLHDAKRLVQEAESSGTQCVFIDVAMWNAKEGSEYVYEGAVTIKAPHTETSTVRNKPPEKDVPWY